MRCFFFAVWLLYILSVMSFLSFILWHTQTHKGQHKLLATSITLNNVTFLFFFLIHAKYGEGILKVYQDRLIAFHATNCIEIWSIQWIQKHYFVLTIHLAIKFRKCHELCTCMSVRGISSNITLCNFKLLFKKKLLKMQVCVYVKLWCLVSSIEYIWRR